MTEAKVQIGTDYGVRLINLDRDTDRLASVRKWFSEVKIDFDRFAAVQGSAVSDLERSFFVGRNRSVGDGTLGCALSHISVWVWALKSDFEHVLVLEDDAKPLRDIPNQFADLNIPSDYDLCYVNQRMVPKRFVQTPGDIGNLTLDAAMSQRDSQQRGHGTDGYFISRRGAERLLRLFTTDRILTHVDHQLIACGMTQPQLESIATNSKSGAAILRCHQRRLSRPETATIYVRVPPFVKQSDGGQSTRLEEG
jgi:GR25 family glycosyltransferase involved in LPS biosynthesis